VDRVGLFDAMPAVWRKLSEVERREVCSLFDEFTGDYKSLFVQYTLLGHAPLDDMDKLRGCYYITKEDPTVFVDPVPQLPPFVPPMEQTNLDNVPGVRFRPNKFLLPYLEDKAANPSTKVYCKICHVEHFSHSSRCRRLAADLFVAMCNKVCYDHQTDDVGLEPSSYLDVEFTKEQRKMLSPTHRDVQIGVILSQIFGEKASTKIAKRRVEFMTGNINSYARLLNGPEQLERIQTYSDLAASLSDYNNEVNQQKESARAEKKQVNEEKLLKKAEKAAAEEIKRNDLLPGLMVELEKGAEHISISVISGWGSSLNIIFRLTYQDYLL
jgi:hypothetical protein